MTTHHITPPAKDTLHKRHVKMMDKLAAFVVTVKPDQFDMTFFRGDRSYPGEKHACGTAGCFIGWGPAAGIRAQPHEDWPQYSGRVSGFSFETPLKGWGWLFGEEWAETDNTPEGAAARWYYLRDHGLPANWDDQMLGTAPLCYRVPK